MINLADIIYEFRIEFFICVNMKYIWRIIFLCVNTWIGEKNARTRGLKVAWEPLQCAMQKLLKKKTSHFCIKQTIHLVVVVVHHFHVNSRERFDQDLKQIKLHKKLTLWKILSSIFFNIVFPLTSFPFLLFCNLRIFVDKNKFILKNILSIKVYTASRV